MSDENERRRCRRVKIEKFVMEVQDGGHLMVQRKMPQQEWRGEGGKTRDRTKTHDRRE